MRDAVRSGRIAALSAALVCVASAAAAPARAQVTEDFEVWSALLGTVDLTPDTIGPSIWLDTHVRRSDAGTVHILRPGVGLRIAPFLSVWGGYAWVPTFSDATSNAVHEHRIWEQVILQHTTAFRLALMSRTRVEQRFSDAGPDLGFRLRQFVRAGWTFVDGFPLGVVVWDELFVGLAETSWAPPPGIDQNRLFVGLYALIPSIGRVEAGYLSTYLVRPSGDRAAHVVAINIFISVRPDPPATPADEGVAPDHAS